MKMSIMLVNFLLLCLYGVVQGQTTPEPCDNTGIDCVPGEDLPPGDCIEFMCDKDKDYGKVYAKKKIDGECGKCSANNDPHITTFDGNKYDWHGHGTYVLSQEGCDLCPEKFVNSLLVDCITGAPYATCVGTVYFQPEPGTFIIIEKSDPLSNSTISGNGFEQQVPCKEGQVQVINGTNNATVWMNSDCIYVMGFNATGYLLRICESGNAIYANRDLFNNTCGLCGNWNESDDPDMDLRFRNGTYFPVPDQSLTNPGDRIIADEFGDDWEVLPEGDCPGDITMTTTMQPPTPHKKRHGNPCNISSHEEQYKDFETDCSNKIRPACDGIKEKTIKSFIEGCSFDQCIAWRTGHKELQKKWLEERKDLCKTEVSSAPGCSPGKCSFENENGQCFRRPKNGFYLVGEQQCKGGCKCYIKDPIGCSPKECSFENDKGVCSLEPIDGFHPCGEQQCRDGCECYVEDAAEPKEPGINVNIKQLVNLNNGCGCPGCC